MVSASDVVAARCSWIRAVVLGYTEKRDSGMYIMFVGGL